MDCCPMLFLISAFCWWHVFGEKYCAREGLGTTITNSVDLQHPLLCGLGGTHFRCSTVVLPADHRIRQERTYSLQEILLPLCNFVTGMIG